MALLGQHESAAERPAEIAIALWFHDAIYAVTRKDNERKSADWARSVLADAGADPIVIERIEALIMATCHDAEAETVDARLLVDIDLAILGAQAQRYAEYETQIRAEYAWVPRMIYGAKRRAILQAFLDREHIFQTEPFRVRYERAARANLTLAIAALQ